MAKRWVAGLVVASVVLLGACGDDGDDGEEASEETTTSTSSTTTTLDEEGTAEVEAAIGESVSGLFDGAVPIEDRVQYLEDGEALGPLVEEQASILGAQASMTTATVSPETTVVLDEENAEFEFNVLLAGAPVIPDYPGLAVKVDDAWLVSKVTMCDLLRIANIQPEECQNLSG